MEFINAACAAEPDQAETYAALGDLFQRKLWHELTGALDAFVKTPAVASRPLLKLLEEFISKFEARMNQLSYAQLLAAIIEASVECKTLTAAEGIAHLEKVLEAKRARLGPEAALFVELACLLLRLSCAVDVEGLADVKSRLDSLEPLIKSMTGTSETAVFERYYRAETEYYKRVGPPEMFYHAALNLLAYSPADAMTLAQKRVLATDISLAALTGDGVYNFGEVLATPILECLKDTPNAWLGDLLRVFSRGDIDAFNLTVHDQKAAYFGQPALAARHDFVKQKIALLALMNLIFETPAQDRTIAFADIAKRVKLAIDAVEWLVMRAMALDLVRGTLDEVGQEFEVTWVLPRVLDNDQINHLIQRIDEVSNKTLAAQNLITDQTLEIL